MFASNCEELQSERVMREFLHHLLSFSGAAEKRGSVSVATPADRLFLAWFIILFLCTRFIDFMLSKRKNLDAKPSSM